MLDVYLWLNFFGIISAKKWSSGFRENRLEKNIILLTKKKKKILIMFSWRSISTSILWSRKIAIEAYLIQKTSKKSVQICPNLSNL